MTIDPRRMVDRMARRHAVEVVLFVLILVVGALVVWDGSC